MTTPERVLACLQQHGFQVSQKVIAEECGICVRQVQRVLELLREKNVVVRRPASYQCHVADTTSQECRRRDHDMPIENKGQMQSPIKRNARVDDDDEKLKYRKPSSSSPDIRDVDLILAELRRYQPTIGRDVAFAVARNLRSKSPKITGQEAAGVLRNKAQSCGPSVRDMIAVLRNWSARDFSPADLEDYRIGQERLAFEHAEELEREGERLAEQEAERQIALREIQAREARRAQIYEQRKAAPG